MIFRLNMPTIVHFEIPADDVGRAKKFYSDLFGWKMEKWPGADSSSSNMEYWLISTIDDKGNKAAISGGMMKRQGQHQHHQHITNFIDVNSIDEYSAKIEKLGGKVVVSKMAVQDMGYFAVCHDTENNSFGIWEPNKNAK
jgi:predicted enzyme related to lactoylglutathione lyase